jgi:hypothetical protein
MKYVLIASLALIPSLVPAADDLISVDAPDQVYPGTVAPVTVVYEATQTREILVFFQLNQSPWTNYGTKRTAVPAGSGTVDVAVPISEVTPIAAGAYKFGVNLVPVGGNWGSQFDTITQAGVDCVEPPAATNSFETVSVVGPPAFAPGSTVPLYVHYTAETNRTLRVSLRQNSPPGTEYSIETVSVPAGSGGITFDLNIDAGVPTATGAYSYVAGLLPEGGSWADRIDDAVQDGVDGASGPNMFTVLPAEYADALMNPLKGFRPDRWGAPNHEYATLARHYIRWNEIENDESDTIQKIKDFCDTKWAGFEDLGIKVIPRVYLDWDSTPGNEYWPADMITGDYSSTQFTQRLERLIYRLGECWDNDPRVAWVQMGLIGYWGEHHSPSPTAEIQALMGNAFTAAFTNKKFLVRHPDEFTAYEVGIYWDSWAHIQQVYTQGAEIEHLNNTTERWKTCPMEGETAYNWGDNHIQPGDDPDDTLTDPVHREFLIDTIYNFHGSGLGWIANYTQTDPVVQAGAAEVQKAFGYRFVIPQISCSSRVEPGDLLRLHFAVQNTGAAPFYENWPVEFSLLDPVTGLPLWKTILDEIDVRQWLPGDQWDEDTDLYQSSAGLHVVDISITVPRDRVPKGEYIAALAVLDPVGREPALRLAVNNYYSGGRHAIGRVGIGLDIAGSHELDPGGFDNPQLEGRLPYALQPRAANTGEVIIASITVNNPTDVHLTMEDSGEHDLYVVQRSQDIVSGEWEAVSILPGTTTPLQWLGPVTNGQSAAFYRVLAE